MLKANFNTIKAFLSGTMGIVNSHAERLRFLWITQSMSWVVKFFQKLFKIIRHFHPGSKLAAYCFLIF